ncbi:hypothetical protein PhCBS80983_g05303 [Powellomyces hirtus]|uniref:DNA damage-inducible protein 1 n=1 Tax=Powellomyces hirtus TaxID=109895 RepID=A0A507DW81_9FUNG|nr:hypothetical protein PhCBS80983_g05303 [Powellomyces hirtus]
MRIHISDEDGLVHSLDVDGNMELENLRALIEAEMSTPFDQQVLSHNGKALMDPKTTLLAAGIRQDDMLLVQRRQVPRKGASGSEQTPQNVAETVRQQILADPYMLRQLTSQNPALAEAAMNSPAEFQRMYLELETRRRELEERQRQQEEALRNADPFDENAQRRIEEAIRQENISQNMENAMEYHPESFGRVVMLYIDAEVNGHHVKAFVDSGAQATIMTPELAEKCNIMHLLDVRFAGIAQGVGTAKILGRIHSAQMKLGSQYLPCSFTIMEGKGVDLLFGLDMLKRHQAIIDLEKNALRIHGEEVRFLSEHELPEKARWEGENDATSPLEGGSAALGAVHPPGGLHPGVPPAGISAAVPGSASSAASTPAPAPTAKPTPPPAQARGYSEDKIKMLMDLGIPRAQALQALDAAGGDADVAASMLFQ